MVLEKPSITRTKPPFSRDGSISSWETYPRHYRPRLDEKDSENQFKNPGGRHLLSPKIETLFLKQLC